MIGFLVCIARRWNRSWIAVSMLAALLHQAIPASQLGAQQSAGFTKVGRIEHPPVKEASGLVASRRYPGVFWTICDSGNLPHLFAIDRVGKLLAEYELDKTANVDWESIAVDDQGNLYIGDVGNNVSLPLRWVLTVREPDPRTAAISPDGPAGIDKLPVEGLASYRFPAAPFDVEGTFFRNDSIYLLSKVRQNTGLYRLCLDKPAGFKTLAKVCDVPAIDTVTGADISADGRRVALCSYREVMVFELGEADATALAGEPVRRISFQASGVEACAWDGEDILLVSEDRGLYRVSLSH
jgi:hypothetical protein